MKTIKIPITFGILLLTLFSFSNLFSQNITSKDFYGSWNMYYYKIFVGRFTFFKDSLIIKTFGGRRYTGTYSVDIDHNIQYIAFSWLDNTDSIQVAYDIIKVNSQEIKLKGRAPIQYSEKEHKWEILERQKEETIRLLKDHHSNQGAEEYQMATKNELLGSWYYILKTDTVKLQVIDGYHCTLSTHDGEIDSLQFKLNYDEISEEAYIWMHPVDRNKGKNYSYLLRRVSPNEYKILKRMVVPNFYSSLVLDQSDSTNTGNLKRQ